MENKKPLEEQVRKLGYKGEVTTRYAGHLRDVVYVDGERIGIWDYIRKTFVD